jgi:hypothetical protein
MTNTSTSAAPLYYAVLFGAGSVVHLHDENSSLPLCGRRSSKVGHRLALVPVADVKNGCRSCLSRAAH